MQASAVCSRPPPHPPARKPVSTPPLRHCPPCTQLERDRVFQKQLQEIQSVIARYRGPLLESGARARALCVCVHAAAARARPPVFGAPSPTSQTHAPLSLTPPAPPPPCSGAPAIDLEQRIWHLITDQCFDQRSADDCRESVKYLLFTLAQVCARAGQGGVGVWTRAGEAALLQRRHARMPPRATSPPLSPPCPPPRLPRRSSWGLWRWCGARAPASALSSRCVHAHVCVLPSMRFRGCSHAPTPRPASHPTHPPLPQAGNPQGSDTLSTLVEGIRFVLCASPQYLEDW